MAFPCYGKNTSLCICNLEDFSLLLLFVMTKEHFGKINALLEFFFLLKRMKRHRVKSVNNIIGDDL